LTCAASALDAAQTGRLPLQAAAGLGRTSPCGTLAWFRYDGCLAEADATNGYAMRFPGSIVWPGKTWEYSLFLTETNQETPNYTQLDERASWFYEASPKNRRNFVR
jgi:hypothetical protein